MSAIGPPAESNYTLINIGTDCHPMELKTARLTVLIDPATKAAFEDLCRNQDMTPSQVVRRLIREYMDQQRGLMLVRRAAAAKKRSIR